MRSFIQTFSENLLQTVLSIPKIIILSKFRTSLPFEHKKSNECVILGNGPSLNQSLENHLSFIKNRDCIAVNLFCATEAYAKIKPSSLVMAAPEFFDPEVDASYTSSINNFFDGLVNNTHWPLVLYLPFEVRKFDQWKGLVKKNSNILIYYFNNTPIDGFKFFVESGMKFGWGLPRAHNVLNPTLIIAIRLKYQKIYLLGADHNWLNDLWVDDENRVMLRQKHFYDENTAKAQQMFKRGKGKRNLFEVLDKFYFSFKAYFIINEYAIKKGIQIFNCTPNSFIDAFPRLKLKEIK